MILQKYNFFTTFPSFTPTNENGNTNQTIGNKLFDIL